MPARKRLVTMLIISVVLISLSVSMRIIYDYNARSPRLMLYEKKNEVLRSEYNALLKELNKDEALLADFQTKDDRMYRSVFEMDPIPSSIREAGTGGAEKYTSLNSISDPELIIESFTRLDNILNRAMIQSRSFSDLEEAAITKRELIKNKPSIKPIAPSDPHWLTSTFGYRADPFHKRRTYHHGIDISGPVGLNIYAAGNGVVSLAEFNRFGYGKEVVIDHGFGLESRYAHLHEILVKPGDEIVRGQVIGTMGNSGRSTGPHLHYEIRVNNRAVNPFYYFYEELSEEEYAEIIHAKGAE